MKNVQTTVLIPFEMYDFCKNSKLKFSPLLRAAIAEKMREASDGVGSSLKEEVRRREAFQNLAQKQRDFLEKKGLLDEWVNGENGGN